jgi:ribosome biogenesis GTPase
MRVLELTDDEAGIADVIADIGALVGQCRFSDCKHVTEPDCIIQSALEHGEIDLAKLARWNRLVAEEHFNSSSMAERKSA